VNSEFAGYGTWCYSFVAVKVYKLKRFARVARKERITNAQLRAAVAAAITNPDAVLGGGVFKQRIARRGEGKSGGYRTLLFLRRGTRAIFAYGFAKNELDNIAGDDLESFKVLAKAYLKRTAEEMRRTGGIGRSSGGTRWRRQSDR
jgi:hypothetical protein